MMDHWLSPEFCVSFQFRLDNCRQQQECIWQFLLSQIKTEQHCAFEVCLEFRTWQFFRHRPFFQIWLRPLCFCIFKCYCIYTLKGTTLMHTETVARQCDDAIHLFGISQFITLSYHMKNCVSLGQMHVSVNLDPVNPSRLINPLVKNKKRIY